MKQLKGILLMAMAIVCFTSVNAQSSKTKVKEGNVAVADTVYYCPMKCEGEKTYKKAGKCPVCNMALKKTKPANVKTGHDGHNHN